MRRSLVVAAAVVALSCLVGIAADVFQTYGLDRQGWSESFLSALTARWYNPFETPAKLKALAPAERVAVVNALGAIAKVWVDTPEFKAAYKQKYEASLPDELKPPRTAKQIADGMRADMKKNLVEIDEALKGLSGDLRKQMEAAAIQMRASLKEQEAMVDAMAAQQAQEEKQRYEEAKNRPPDPDATPADPRVGLKRGLKGFLDVTTGVDYAAALKPASGRKVFASPAFEQKPKEWKLCFRAGKDACEAARAFATSWLAELK
jgi:uncharacterized lipoprotein YmbA